MSVGESDLDCSERWRMGSDCCEYWRMGSGLFCVLENGIWIVLCVGEWDLDCIECWIIGSGLF